MNRHEQCVEGWVKGMRTDKERLDWLDGQTGARLRCFGTYWTLEPSNEKTQRGNSIREAIDKAMEYEKTT